MFLRQSITLRLFLSVLTLAAVASGIVHAQERRVALVIGVDNYTQIRRLDNAVEDARAIAARLRDPKLGFDVLGPLLNPTRDELIKALDVLEQRLRGADTGLLFFAGHAVEVNGRNILLPADMPRAETPRQVESRGILVADVLNEMQALVPRVIAILDACRDNPFHDATRGSAPVVGTRGGLTDRGLEPPQPSPEGGRFVVFAASPGATAIDRLPGDPARSNGLFTRYLLRALETPGRPINLMMADVRDQVANAARRAGRRQVPHLDDRMIGSGEFMLIRLPIPSTSAPSGVTQPASPDSIEVEYWRSVQNSRNPADLEAYLRDFPNGRFTALARNRLGELRPAPVEPPIAGGGVGPTAVGQVAGAPPPVVGAGAPVGGGAPNGAVVPAVPRPLTREEVVTAQRALTQLGYDTGGADGELGPRSSDAMKRFAQAMLRPDQDTFDTVNLARLEQTLRDFLRLTERGGISPRGIGADTVTGSAARKAQGSRAEFRQQPDHEEAAYWFGLAAREHDALALQKLGLLLVRGQGVKQDLAGGSLLWRLAASRGDANAAFTLAEALEQGAGLNRNLGWARYYYDVAERAGHPKAREALRRVSP